MESQESNVFDDINRQTHYRCYYCEREVEYSFAGNNWRHTGTGVTHCDCVATPSNVEIPMTVDEIVATLPDEKPVD